MTIVADACLVRVNTLAEALYRLMRACTALNSISAPVHHRK